MCQTGSVLAFQGRSPLEFNSMIKITSVACYPYHALTLYETLS